MAAAIDEFGRRRRFLRTVTATCHLSYSLLLLPSNMQFRCMKYLVFFGYLSNIFVSVGSSKIFGYVLVRNILCVILCFGDFFCFSGSVFGSQICSDFCFQRLQFEGSNEFSQIWLITVINYIPLVLADHCTSSIFYLQLWLHC